jgi:ribosomal RNA-processing protein 36
MEESIGQRMARILKEKMEKKNTKNDLSKNINLKNNEEEEEKNYNNEDIIQHDESTDASGQVSRKRRRTEPVEMTSQRPVGRFMKVFEPGRDPASTRRDPRFEEASGEFNNVFFSKSFSFVDEMRENEVKTVQEALKKEKSQKEKDKLRKVLVNLKQQLAQHKQKSALDIVLQKDKKARREAMEQGKTPFYHKKSELRELAAVERFKMVEKEGGEKAVNKLISRKRKKLMGKDKKALPEFSRRGVEG